VAAHLEPEILIVDEVLAVGDSTFQKKCLGKMKDVSQEGRTVILVSHNMTAVRTLCTRGVWLHKGKLQMEGGAQEVVSQYLKSMSASSAHMQWDDPATAPGTSEVRLNRIAVTAAGRTDEDFTVATPLTLEVRYWNLGVAQPLNVSVEVYNTEEVCVFSSFDKPVVYPRGLLRARCEIPAHLLNDAMYRFRVLIVRDANSIIYAHEGVTIEVNDVPREVAYFGKWVGTVRPTLQWSSDVVEAESEVLAGGARV
jgi:lipopolysaccharide transport system ATP-binding protein